MSAKAAKVVAKRPGRKKKDPNAPASVSTAYQFFFKETQASVKTHNPNAKFGEVSKIVASMWEALGEEDRAVYKKRNAEDKIRHEQEMNEYRAKQIAEGIDPDAPATAAGKADIQPKKQTRGLAAKKAAAAASAVVLTAGNHGKVSVAKPAVVAAAVTPPTSSSESKEEEEVVEEEEVTDNDCIREGCGNKAVKNVEWEDEYCSNACVVEHCKNVFSGWVIEKQQG